jgi:hypothetical protein
VSVGRANASVRRARTTGGRTRSSVTSARASRPPAPWTAERARTAGSRANPPETPQRAFQDADDEGFGSSPPRASLRELCSR